jgi:NitT/TauT family transport system substrate-binding protein
MKARISRRLLAAVVVLAASFMANAATAKDKITVVMSSFDLLFWPTLAAKELGYFDAENIEPDIVRTGGGAKSLAAVAGGDAHFNIGAPASAFRARAKGSDVMMIAPVIAQYTDNVTMSDAWAKKNNLTRGSSYDDKLKALKGMTIGVSSVGGGADQLVRFLAKQAKLDPDRDMTISALGSGEAMLAALSRGRIDGFVVPPPNGEEAIRRHNAHPMITTSAGEVKALDGFVYIGVIVRESWVAKNQDLAVRFLRAMQRGLEAVHDPATTEKARDAVKAKYFAETDAAFYKEIWDAAKPSYPKTIELKPDMVDRIVNFVNATTPEPLDEKATKTGWTNDYAAKALATMKR